MNTFIDSMAITEKKKPQTKWRETVVLLPIAIKIWLSEILGKCLITSLLGVDTEPDEPIGPGVHQPAIDTVAPHPGPLSKDNISIPKLLGISSANLTENGLWLQGHTLHKVTPLPRGQPTIPSPLYSLGQAGRSAQLHDSPWDLLRLQLQTQCGPTSPSVQSYFLTFLYLLRALP